MNNKIHALSKNQSCRQSLLLLGLNKENFYGIFSELSKVAQIFHLRRIKTFFVSQAALFAKQ